MIPFCILGSFFCYYVCFLAATKEQQQNFAENFIQKINENGFKIYNIQGRFERMF